jgi:hypothetical protein
MYCPVMLLEFPGELHRAIRGRKGWSIAGSVAAYEASEGTHVVHVRWVESPPHAPKDCHWLASMLVSGVAKRVSPHYTAEIAVEWAESVKPAR